MALTKELLGVLDNREEPVAKRLKIADAILKSAELPIHHRESVLLKWIVRNTKNKNSPEVWEMFDKWLAMDQIQHLTRNDVSGKDILYILNTLTKRISCLQNVKRDVQEVLINLSHKLIENKLFQQYFKYDSKSYCNYITTIVSKIEDVHLLLTFLQKELFCKNIIIQEDFQQNFMMICFLPFIHLMIKHKESDMVFQEVCLHLEKCLFLKNYKNFEVYMQQFFENTDTSDAVSFPKLLFESLLTFYKLDIDSAASVYKAVFYSYCKSYSNEFSMVLKLFLLLLEHLRFIEYKVIFFNTSNIQNAVSEKDKDLVILKELLSVLTTNKNNLNFPIQGVTLTETLRKIIIKTLQLTDKSCMRVSLEILSNVIAINPLVIEPIISEILVIVMLSDHSEHQFHYNSLLVAIFEVFAKLHRIQSLISKMIPALKSALEGSFKSDNLTYNFQNINDKESVELHVTDILSEPILSYFSDCVTSLVGWQVMNLFKTFIFHLNAAVDNIGEDNRQHIYIEIVTTLICRFLSSVRMAEHTVLSMVIEKFVTTMDEMRDVLAKFGTSLLTREHNHILIRAYLNVSYTWAELYIILSHYSINGEIKVTRIMDTDSSTCNITYLHSYLTRDQWCTLAQRITNFGEKPCKQIMQKLFVQKIRAMALFDDMYNEVLNSVVKTLGEDVEENWELLVSETFILNSILLKMETQTLIVLGKCLLQDFVEDNPKVANNRCVLDCQILTNSLLYNVIQKLNKLAKRKRKHDQEGVCKSFTANIFKAITDSMFFDATESTDSSLDLFIREFNENLLDESHNNLETKINEEKLQQLLNVLKKLPIVYSSEKVQIVCLFFLIAIFIDFAKSMNESTRNCCESLIAGLIQNNSLLLLNNIPINVILEKFPNIFNNEEIMMYVIEEVFHNETVAQNFESGVNYLKGQLHNDKCLQCAIIFLNMVHKFKKSKIAPERKQLLLNYSVEICKNMLKFLTSVDTCVSVEAYALVLRNYLSRNNEAAVQKVTPLLKEYINNAIEEATTSGRINAGGFTLFLTVLHHKAQFKEVDDELILCIWDTYKTLDVPKELYEEYAQLVVLIFEHITNEQFSAIINSLVTLTMNALNQKDAALFCKYLKTWKSILQCSFNPVKNKVWCTALERLLKEALTPTVTKEMQGIYKEIVNFEIDLIRNTRLLLTPTMTDMLLYTTSIFVKPELEHFASSFDLCVGLLELLLNYRKPIVLDRLPSYLLQYRQLLKCLCAKSNSEVPLDSTSAQDLANCAFRLEKLTKNLSSCNRDMARISVYLIADILQQYEQITLHPNIKIHLNNCLYSLISLCDQHAVSYLMRVLSVASTEMFKVMYENYKKYYRFTGKV